VTYVLRVAFVAVITDWSAVLQCTRTWFQCRRSLCRISHSNGTFTRSLTI